MTRFPHRLRLAALGVAILLAITATLAWAIPALSQQGASGTGYESLLPDEQQRAQDIALQDAGIASAMSAESRTEHLLVERHQETKDVVRSGNWQRRADVYTYLYDSDTLLWAIVNLDTGAVDSVEAAQNVQLPLNENETARAFELLLADPAVMANISAEYQKVTGAKLTQPAAQLKINTLIYRADSMPGANPGAEACGLHRCAQFLLATQDDILINLLPIVDLSAGAVVSAGPFGN